MHIILFDDNFTEHLSPFTLTRAAADIRCGILTIREKWEKHLDQKAGILPLDHLKNKYTFNLESDNLFINGRLLPDADVLQAIRELEIGEALAQDEMILAYRADLPTSSFASKKVYTGATLINRNHNIFSFNEKEILKDFEVLTKGRTSEPLSATNTHFGQYPLFLEKGVKAEAAIFNTTDGPIYLGVDAEVMEGAMIRGPFALCEHATVKMGAKIYGGTTVGPHSKVGGEVSNSVIFGFSNKGHDGFLGNSVLGEWCNLGADTNNSNLKNNYEEVKLWNYTTGNFERTGLQFCGLMMGDHSKCGINTMFNTGTVIGVCANIFGSGFPRNFVPSFSWGGVTGFETYQPKKAFITAEKVMQRRGLELSDTDKEILETIFTKEAPYRTWEKQL